jgi:hypothetical protein
VSDLAAILRPQQVHAFCSVWLDASSGCLAPGRISRPAARVYRSPSLASRLLQGRSNPAAGVPGLMRSVQCREIRPATFGRRRAIGGSLFVRGAGVGSIVNTSTFSKPCKKKQAPRQAGLTSTACVFLAGLEKTYDTD